MVQSGAWSVSGAWRSFELTIAVIGFGAILASVAVPGLCRFLCVHIDSLMRVNWQHHNASNLIHS